MADNETINVIVAMEFAEELLSQAREVSPRLHIEKYAQTVPDKAWASAEILFTTNVFPKPEQAPNLRWIQLCSAGANQIINSPLASNENLEITTASGIHATPMSEFSLAMMLAFTYKLPQILEFQTQATWIADRTTVFLPTPLRGRTLGIVGYGNIGRELARIADALGMIVLATKRDVMHPADDDSYHEAGTGDPDGELPTRLYPPQALASMARECDFLVITTPLTDDTRHIVDANVLKAMKKTAVIVNVARGAVIDEAALIDALQNHRIGGAALDVFEQEPLPADNPLWKLDNVILSAHISGSVIDYDERCAKVFVENLERYLEGQPLLNRVHKSRGY
ncbi:MAG TPA: D-2-hydroxyacid dehydrogenase [Phototrophicaceae bacterium]|nr:D-2-hydroxyacid dehydrogenase [Phototrophicaceae bacterium]